MKKTLVVSTLAAVILTGCTTQQPLQQRDVSLVTPPVTVTRNVQPVSPDAYGQAPEVVRYDRYLLVSTDPAAVQRDPLSQIIDIRIPASVKPTVADALRYSLRQSGYNLCATGPANGVLYRQALPAVQYQLGPMRLRTALQVLAGPAWQLEVDDVQRVVCHSLRDGYQLPASQLPPSPTHVFITQRRPQHLQARWRRRRLNLCLQPEDG
ncbi:integrating conjugative element protein PilL, PFGI-1 class [Serratia liquefaciens]|nr:integrating conjugative element protein PilL, PFGI-1 class [Serratia liquefaciens]